MSALDFDVKKHLPNIIDALVEVYGEEYRDIITQRINNTHYAIYKNRQEVFNYYTNLLARKEQELSLKFLEQIGIDTSQYKKYNSEYDENIGMIVSEYLGGFHNINYLYRQIPQGIKSFRITKENVSSLEINQAQVKFLNFYRGQNVSQLTVETLDEFKMTEEYQEILKSINQYLDVLYIIMDEHEEYAKSISEYLDYYDQENNARDRAFLYKKKQLYEDIFDMIPFKVVRIFNSQGLSIEEQAEKFLGDLPINMKSYIECFSQKDDDILSDPNSEVFAKKMILYYRLKYFSQMGIKLDVLTMIDQYDDIIQRDEVKALIPSKFLVDKISKCREKRNKEVDTKYICDSQTYRDNLLIVDENTNNRNSLYFKIKNNEICISPLTYGENKLIPILYFGIRSDYIGFLDYVFLHEQVHAIETFLNNDLLPESGFDTLIQGNSGYSSEKKRSLRKYEVFNETFTDLIAIETKNILHSKEIYFVEPKEITKEDLDDFNTFSIIKKILVPIFQMYRSEIMKARLFGDTSDLFEVMGEDNFEDLNDIINNINVLLSGFYQDAFDKDEFEAEYYDEISRLEQLYNRIGIEADRTGFRL